MMVFKNIGVYTLTQLINYIMTLFLLLNVIILILISQTLYFFLQTNEWNMMNSVEKLNNVMIHLGMSNSVISQDQSKHVPEHQALSQVDHAMEVELQNDDNLKIKGLGENGVGVHLQVDEEHQKEMKRYGGFNELLSDRISFSRNVPDTRDPRCRSVSYDISLPTASIVIIFHNEAWSAILRTVHSVINRSPQHLIEEIILVDDFSDRSYLKYRLEYYIKTRLPSKVKLIRLKERSGLIRARLAGAEKCVGDVIVFMDAHCEVGYTWLEPLLQRIKEKRTAVVVPIIDGINSTTLEYQDYVSMYGYEPMGSFRWNGQFMFAYIEQRDPDILQSPMSPRRSPTMIGCFFAMDRKYFWEMGSFDSQMDIWGGENLELSFRIWQCGGSLEIIPCSKAGHIFRVIHPYTFPRNKDTHGYNTARMAEVWMDEYKHLFYFHRSDLKNIDTGDLTERHEIRRKLKCNSFQWYLDNVHPDLIIPTKNAIAYGQVRNKNICLDTLNQNVDVHELGIYKCFEHITPSQEFILRDNGEIRKDYKCAEIQNTQTNPVRVIMYPCHGQKGNQEWKLTANGELVHVGTGLCLNALDNNATGKVSASHCDGSVTQIWQWGMYI